MEGCRRYAMERPSAPAHARPNPHPDAPLRSRWLSRRESRRLSRCKRATSGDGLTDELKRQAAFRWLGDEAEAQRLQQEQTYHYVRWSFLVAVAAVIAGLIAVGLALLG